jgi:hypothetical protein
MVYGQGLGTFGNLTPFSPPLHKCGEGERGGEVFSPFVACTGAGDLRTEGDSGGFPILQKVYLSLGTLPRKILDKVA